MTKTYPLYVTVLCCVLVAALCAGVAFDVGRRIGSNAVRQEAIRAGAANYLMVQCGDPIDASRTRYVREVRWMSPDNAVLRHEQVVRDQLEGALQSLLGGDFVVTRNGRQETVLLTIQSN